MTVETSVPHFREMWLAAKDVIEEQQATIAKCKSDLRAQAEAGVTQAQAIQELHRDRRILQADRRALAEIVKAFVAGTATEATLEAARQVVARLEEAGR